MSYATHVSKKRTPAGQKAHKDQIANLGGGFSFKLDKWKRLERFLILGNEKGSYYANAKSMTIKNVEALDDCYAEDSTRTIDIIVDVSVNGRAPRNDAAVFALAYLSNDSYALAQMPRVCRIGTHLFQYLDAVGEFRGWGSALKKAVSAWYTGKSRTSVVYQVTKYRQRHGWTHNDVLRKAHPVSAELNDIFAWITGKLDLSKIASDDEAINKLHAFEHLQRLGTADKHEAAKLIREHRMVRETVPTELLKSKEVWEALLENMPLGALVRNLGKLSNIGILKPLSAASKKVVADLTNTEALRKARLHPFALLVAQEVYGAGKGIKGSLIWLPVPQVVEALDDAFYSSFGLVEPTNKNFLLGVDVSGSMGWSGDGYGGRDIAGTNMTPAKAAAAMAMLTVRTEKNYYIHGFADTFRDLKITASDSLDTAMKKTSNMNFGATNCALPMQFALKNKLEVDTFVIYTDCEFNTGNIHPHQALEEYRRKMGVPAKLICVGFVANEISIANPNDAGQLDIVGFDTSAPAIMRDFVMQTNNKD